MNHKICFNIWQDYKEAFSKSDIFTVLLRLVMEALDNEASAYRMAMAVAF